MSRRRWVVRVREVTERDYLVEADTAEEAAVDPYAAAGEPENEQQIEWRVVEVFTDDSEEG